MFKQELPSLGLSVEQGTPAVPGDGKYHVVHDGVVVFSAASRAEAIETYKAKWQELTAATSDQGVSPAPDPQETMRRIREHSDLQAVRSDSFARRAASARQRGGRGGRGGV